jgi:hypothetical protein
LRIFLFNFIENIFCREVSAFTGITYYVSILVLSHEGYYEKKSQEIKKKKRQPSCGLPIADIGNPL